jgi:hypothetical protein
MKLTQLMEMIEGITNDFENGVSDKQETNAAILQLVLDQLEAQALIWQELKA